MGQGLEDIVLLMSNVAVIAGEKPKKDFRSEPLGTNKGLNGSYQIWKLIESRGGIEVPTVLDHLNFCLNFPSEGLQDGKWNVRIV